MVSLCEKTIIPFFPLGFFTVCSLPLRGTLLVVYTVEGDEVLGKEKEERTLLGSKWDERRRKDMFYFASLAIQCLIC